VHRDDRGRPASRRLSQCRFERRRVHGETARLDIDQDRTAPARSIAATVATAVCDTVKTRSPAPMPQARTASSSASVPLPVPIAWPTPIMAAKAASNPSASRPRMYWPPSSTRLMAASISSCCAR